MASDEGVAEFLITYEGPAVDAGRMGARELAISLLAFADLTREAEAVALPDAPPVGLDVQAFSGGSFDVQLVLYTGVTLLTSSPVVAATNLLSLTLGSLELLRRIRGRRIQQRSQIEPGMTRVVLDGDETLVEATNRFTTIERTRFREGVRGFLRPFRTQEIDRVRITVGGHEAFSLTRDEATALEAAVAEPGEVVMESTAPLVLVVTSIAFRKGYVWRLFDGSHTDTYDLLDDKFLSRVESGEETFRSGDRLIARVRVRQVRTSDGGLRIERAIVEVIEHRPAQDTEPLLPAGT